MFHKDILKIDSKIEAGRLCDFIRKQATEMKRDGAVIGISGGIDSAVSAALCMRALGKDKVLGLLLPERESNPVSAKYALMQAKKLEMDTITVDITPTLEGFGTYEKRDEVIKTIFPEYNNQYKSKITLPADLLSRDAFNIFTLKIEDGKDVPIRFEDEVRSKMEDIGAQVRTRGEYKWSGKRDDLVESIRNRVRQVIAENLKK